MAMTRGCIGWTVAVAALLVATQTANLLAQWTGGGGSQGSAPTQDRSNDSNWQTPPPSTVQPPQRQSEPPRQQFSPPPAQQLPRERPAWMAPLTESDKDRIEDIIESRTKGRDRAAADAGSRAARAAIALMDLDGIPIVEKQLLGNWQCRTYGLGGTLYPNRGADVSGAFRCRIERDKSGLVLRKTTGSVTWLARLTPITPQSMLYYGTYIARGDKQPIYPAGDAYHHQVGILQQVDRERFRIEMPRPTHSATSDHDVVELFREH